MWLSLSSLQKTAQVTHQKEQLMSLKLEHTNTEGGNACRVCVCLLVGVNAYEYVQTRTHTRYFMPCQCSKPDWQCFLSSSMFLPQSFSFIMLGKDSQQQRWNKLSGLSKALYLTFRSCSSQEGLQRVLPIPGARSLLCHPATAKAEGAGCVWTIGTHVPLKNAPFWILLLYVSWSWVRQEEMLRTDVQKSWRQPA